MLLPRDGLCAAASGRYEFPGFDAYIAALAWPDRDDIAALALTLGILCFAVASAVLFLRTRRHLAAVEAACAEALADGVHSADVVLNILSRRRDPGPAPTILTPDALRLRHLPIADCARYDSLRRAS